MSVLLEARNVSKSFGELRALEDVNIAIAAGELVCVIGPNGAGKTTLVNLLTGLLTPTTGDVLFMGRSIAGIGPVRLADQGLARSFQLIATSAHCQGDHLHGAGFAPEKALAAILAPFRRQGDGRSRRRSREHFRARAAAGDRSGSALARRKKAARRGLGICSQSTGHPS